MNGKNFLLLLINWTNNQKLYQRYKNGEPIPNNHVKYNEYPIVKIETVDPVDEGAYQCVARNDYGEAISTYYVHVVPRLLFDDAPLNPRCFPKNNGIITVEFETSNPVNGIQYFIASDSPRNFYPQLSQDVKGSSFDIDTRQLSFIKPLKPFYLYMRNLKQVSTTEGGHKMIISQLSKPVMCATQGIEVKLVKPENGERAIFLRWDAPKDLNVTGYTIQLQNNDTSNQITFANEVIGSYMKWPSVVNWAMIANNNNLVKIPANSTNATSWTELRVPGNVTGLYIINTDEVSVRLLGSVLEGGEIFAQNLKGLDFKNIKASNIILQPLLIGDIESRGAEIYWRGLNDLKCASQMCWLMVLQSMDRGGDKSNCEEM